MWNLKKINKTPNLQIERTDWWLPGVGGWGETGEGSQKVQTSSYKMNESWGCNITWQLQLIIPYCIFESW